jgi:hypothetical protein
MIQYSSVIDGPAYGIYDPDRERSPTVSPDPDARAQVETAVPLSPRAIMERQSELYQERQWELYRRSVAEGMPDSDYRTAVLAGIAHHLMRLDSIEASRSPFIEKAARARTDRSRGL